VEVGGGASADVVQIQVTIWQAIPLIASKYQRYPVQVSQAHPRASTGGCSAHITHEADNFHHVTLLNLVRQAVSDSENKSEK
jgi:peroxiredoxin